MISFYLKKLSLIFSAAIFINFISLSAAFAALSGNYTINPTGGATASNYLTFTSAISDLSTGTRPDGGPAQGVGVSGKVTFTVAAGNYNENITIPAITGASASNPIVFDGGAGNAASRVISNGNGNYIIQFNGCSYITFKNLTISNTTIASSASCVWFNGATTGTACAYDKLQNCNINSGFFASTGFSFWYAVYFSAGAGNLAAGYFNNDTITGCNIYGGEHGIAIAGTTGSEAAGMLLSNNTVTNFYQYGIYCSKCAAPKIKGNIVSSSTNYGASFSINIASCIPTISDFIEVSGNQIPTVVRGGIFVSSDNANASYPTMIYNNFVGGASTSSSSAVGIRGIYLNTSSYVNIWFNSINLNNLSTSTTAGTNVGLSDPTGACTNLDIRDNIISYNPSAGSGVASSCIPFYYGSANITTNVVNFDYNIFYTNYNNGGNYNVAWINSVSYTDKTIINALGFNTHSLFVNPNFKTSTNLHLQNATYGHTGISLPGVTTDIDGETRPGTPHIGADDFPASGTNDIGVSLITSPVSPFAPGNNTLTVLVTNVGTNQITAGNIYYQLNGVTVGPQSLSGIMPLAAGTSASYTFTAPVSFNAGGSAVKVFTSQPNGTADTYNGNDTVSTTLYSWLNGAYTINPAQSASTTNFPSFTAAANALNCGVPTVIRGPVVFNVAAGTYDEQIEIDGSDGASATNTITFDGGNPSNVTIQHNGIYGSQHTIRLKGCQYVNLINLTITTTSLTYGWPLHFFGNGTNYNRVFNCNINVPANSGESLVPVMATGNQGLAPSIVPGGCLAAYNRIDSCAINKGFAGIDWYGTSDQVNCVSNIFQGNTITNASSYGISCSYTNAMKILNNTVTMNNSGSGIMMFYCNVSATATPDFIDCSGNIITGFTGGQSFYGGICGSPVWGTAATHNRVSNNIVVSSSLSSGGICIDFESGFVNESPYAPQYTDFVFNTLVYTGTGTGYCYLGANYQSADNNTFTDNICAITGTGASMPVYLPQTGNLTSSDYNVFYNTANTNIFNNGGTIYTSANVIGNGGYNANSIVANPNFVGGSNYHITALPAPCKYGTPITGITKDIDNQLRGNPPVIGADEIAVTAVVAGPIIGSTVVCAPQNGVTYSISSVGGATNYNWILPTGATIASGSNSNNITVNFSSAAVSGNMQVSLSNSTCPGVSSAPSVFPVSVGAATGAPGTIRGTSSVCAGENGVAFSVPAINNATGYNWALPTGATIASGSNTNSITVDFSPGASNGNITVNGTGSCGNGTTSSPFAIAISSLPDTAGNIIGTTTVCAGQNGINFSVPAIANATGYNWVLPAGATIAGSSNTNSIVVNFSGSASGGNITVNGTSNCGSGVTSSPFAITVNQIPVAGTLSPQLDTVCSGTRDKLTLTGISGDSISWQSSLTGTNFTHIIGARGNPYTTNALAQTIYFRAVVSNGNCSDTSAPVLLTVPPVLNAAFTQSVSGKTATFNSSSSTGAIHSYHWDFGDNGTSNESNPVHTFAKDSTYYVCLTLSDGSNCSFTTCQNVTISADGVNTVSALGTFSVFPNPSNGNLLIDIQPFADRTLSISVFNTMGQMVYQNNLADAINGTNYFRQWIDLSNLPAGIYFLNVKGDVQQRNAKVIITK